MSEVQTVVAGFQKSSRTALRTLVLANSSSAEGEGGARSSSEVPPADDFELLAQEEVVPFLEMPGLPFVESGKNVGPIPDLQFISYSERTGRRMGRTRRGAMRFSYCSFRSNSWSRSSEGI